MDAECIKCNIPPFECASHPKSVMTEPSADIRASAHSLREVFVALIAEDFTEQQALIIIGQILAASFGASQ